jgi:hypothetical protein
VSPDFDLPMTGDDPEPDEVETDPDTLAAELGLGIDLSPEEQEAADAMVRHLEAQFSTEDETAEEPEPEAEVEPEAPETEPEVPEPASAPAQTVNVDGIAVPVEEAVAYLTRREAQRQAEAQAPPPPEPPKPPEWLDQDDPAQMAMWAELQSVKAGQAQLAQNQQREAQQSAVARAQADATTGISTFRQLHPELSEDDITTLRTHAVSLDIIDGLAKTRSGPEAITKALDIAYWDHPEFRAKATAAPSPAALKKAERAEKKEKLNALGGSSGSVPRQETRSAPKTDREMKDAAAQWLREQNVIQ